jgi:hypothetical protein
MRFQVVTEASMKMTVFYAVAPCNLVETDRSGAAYCFHHRDYYLTETSANLYEIIRRVPEHGHLPSFCSSMQPQRTERSSYTRIKLTSSGKSKCYWTVFNFCCVFLSDCQSWALDNTFPTMFLELNLVWISCFFLLCYIYRHSQLPNSTGWRVQIVHCRLFWMSRCRLVYLTTFWETCLLLLTDRRKIQVVPSKLQPFLLFWPRACQDMCSVIYYRLEQLCLLDIGGIRQYFWRFRSLYILNLLFYVYHFII